jgi:hypothetical protein
LIYFVSGHDSGTDAQLASLGLSLDQVVGPDGWRIDVVDVFLEPEKALRSEVFATPTLLRAAPGPVFKLIGSIEFSDRVVAMMSSSAAVV